jgi:hypothetical protein
MNNGWIKIHRCMMDNPLYHSEPFNRTHAWIDLLLLANSNDNFFYKRGIRVNIQRGQIGHDADTLAKRWKWSRGKVERYLTMLESDGMIVRQKSNVTTLISICKYDDYQANDKANSKANDKTNGQQTVKQTDTNKNDKNYKNEKNEENISFLRFWNLYDKKIDRQACERKWNKIDSELHELIFAHVADYVASTPQVQYRKNPETYLNNRSWENEIVMEAKPTEKKYKVETEWAFGLIKDEFESLEEAQAKVEWYNNRKDASFRAKIV